MSLEHCPRPARGRFSERRCAASQTAETKRCRQPSRIPRCLTIFGRSCAPRTLTDRRRLLVSAVDDVVGVVGVARADRLLVELADAGARHLVDERPALRQPPANYLVAQMIPQLGRGG